MRTKRGSVNYGKINKLSNIRAEILCWLWQPPSSTTDEIFCRATELVTRNSPWNSIPRPKSWTMWGPKWKFIGAWSRGSNAHRPAWTHARSGIRWITNIVFRMRGLFHFHAGFTGRRDYQSRGHAHSFLNLRSTTFILVLPSFARRGFDVIEDSTTVKLRYGSLKLSRWQNYTTNGVTTTHSKRNVTF